MDIAYLGRLTQRSRPRPRAPTRNVLRLMDEDPDSVLALATTAFNAYTAQDYPDLFAQIKERVAEAGGGQWAACGVSLT